MSNDRTCVLLPYYNAGKDLIKSLDSLKDDDVDIIVVDDGSKEKKARDYVNSYSDIKNIILIENDENRGIEHALNTGLDYCLKKYDFIARLDCGDQNKSNRIKKQVSYLRRNPNLAIIGSWADFVSTEGKHLFTSKMPPMQEIEKKIKYNNMFIHPTVMFRSSIISKVGGYSYDYPAAEDYEFFYRVVNSYECDNIQESLLNYVVDGNSISTKKRKRQLLSRLGVQWKYFQFEWNAVYGILRSLIILFTPRSLTLLARRCFKEYKL